MCGIAGFLTPDQAALEPTVKRMTGAMARRGPDSEGFAAWPGVGFGHRRLAIIDLSALGAQPMLSDDHSVGVVFNGCIYNFQDVRQELVRLGRKFKSECDTEVLVEGYIAWGIDELVKRLRGMFAFAIWDEPNRTLSLVRDRLGVKPLVYATHGRTFAFASTVAALTQAVPYREIDPVSVIHYLDYGNVAGDQCIFKNIRKLPPATILQWKDGNCQERTYWKLPEVGTASNIRFEEAVEETERRLIESTRLRLIADVPIAALLSGGVDSTLVCWAMSQLNANVTAFTVGVHGDPSDEASDAAATARQLGIPHQVVELPDEQPEALEEAEEAFSEPFASSSGQAMLRVSRAIKSHAKVLLTGDGGDDVFLGYPFLKAAWVGQKTAHMIPGFAAPAIRAGASLLPKIGPLRRARNLLGYSTSGLSSYAQASNFIDYFAKYQIFGDRLQNLSQPRQSLSPSFASARNLLPEVLRYQHRNHFLGEFLPKVDGATMYHSLESRAPILDQTIWEFAAALSPELHFHGGALKAILRAIVNKRVGSAVATRKKQGFTVPVERLLAGKWTSSLDVLLAPNQLERQGWLRPGSLAAPIAEARKNHYVPQQLWRLLLLEHWLERSLQAKSVP